MQKIFTQLAEMLPKGEITLSEHFITFVREGSGKAVYFYYEDIDFTKEEFANLPRHRCIRCTEKGWAELLELSKERSILN